VRKHLEVCPRCRRRLEALGALEAALARLRPERSEAALGAVLDRVRGAEAPAPLPIGEPNRRRRARRWVAGIAATLTLAAGGGIWYAVGRSPAVSAPTAVGEPIDSLPSACFRPEDCGPSAEPLWPPVPI